jgi:hypothetical protein
MRCPRVRQLASGQRPDLPRVVAESGLFFAFSVSLSSGRPITLPALSAAFLSRNAHEFSTSNTAKPPAGSDQAQRKLYPTIADHAPQQHWNHPSVVAWPINTGPFHVVQKTMPVKTEDIRLKPPQDVCGYDDLK